MSVAIYVYSAANPLPMTLYQGNGIIIEMTEAFPNSSRSDIFNGTSELRATTLALSMLDADGIRCGTNAIRSQTIDLTMLNIEGKWQWVYINLMMKVATIIILMEM